MPDTPGDLQAALEDLDLCARDVQQAIDPTGMQAANAIRRYVARLDQEPIASLARTMLPPADFDAWYNPRSRGNCNLLIFQRNFLSRKASL